MLEDTKKLLKKNFFFFYFYFLLSRFLHLVQSDVYLFVCSQVCFLEMSVGKTTSIFVFITFPAGVSKRDPSLCLNNFKENNKKGCTHRYIRGEKDWGGEREEILFAQV